MTAYVLRGGAEHLPLPDESVDLICTSPPYFGLRSYQDGGKHYDGQVGSEPTAYEFLDVLIACTAEWMRVLKPSGSIWVNLGDKYSGPAAGNKTPVGLQQNSRSGLSGGLDSQMAHSAPKRTRFVKDKSLTGLPWRYAIRCIDELELILRAEVVWSKPNGLPESVTDRVRRSHEQWFHFTKLPQYYSAVDEIREAYAPDTQARYTSGYIANKRVAGGQQSTCDPLGVEDLTTNPLGKLPGSVWTIPTQPLRVPEVSPLDGRPLPGHFAAFPMEWPHRIIRGWSPPGVCTGCGEGLRPVTERENDGRQHGIGNTARYEEWAKQNRAAWQEGVRRTITGYVCACTPYTNHPGQRVPVAERTGNSLAVDPGNAPRQSAGSLGSEPRTGPQREYHFDQWTPPPVTPAVVLDPFGGTGTVALVASVLGRTGISVDLSHDYCRVAQWRVADEGQLARAGRRPVRKKPRVKKVPPLREQWLRKRTG